MRERGAGPARCGVTRLTRFGESGSEMVRIRDAVVDAAVARITIQRRAGVSSAHVTTGTRRRRVGACQCKTSSAVVECRTRPARCRVTQLTVLRKVRGDVVWIRGGHESTQVTPGASRIQPRVLSVDMTGCARSSGMRAG